MVKKILMSLVILIFSYPIFAYDTGKSPGKAALYSFIIPGGGQYYNESTWKTVLWGGSEIGFIVLTSYHHNKFLDYKDKRNKASNPQEWAKWDREAGDQLHKRNNGFWWLGSTLILSMLDAYVDAALYNFDDEDQKLKVQFNLNYLGLEYNF